MEINSLDIHSIGKILMNLVRYGNVDSVDVESRTARVRYEDKSNMVSGPLKVLINPPLITIEKTENGDPWSFQADYASVDRKLGLGETYTKSAPDVVVLNKTMEYKCPTDGIDDTKEHVHIVTVHPWLPYIGQRVVCLYLPHGKSDGFVLGGV